MVATGRPKSYRAGWWAGLVIAALAVLLWNGNPRMLNPADITWIDADDPFQHVMGWEQFRWSPLLQYPITKNEGYGLERGSALVYADAIPIAALALRPFSPILPRPFQYLGWWALLSLVLQGYWAARLIRLRTDRTAVIALGAGYFMVAPVLLNRIGVHTALTSQWMILCALWLYFSSREARSRRWAALLLLAVSIHAYLFVMVGAIWAANLVKCRLARTLTRRDLLHAGATVIAVAAWMHCLGYFLVGRGAAAGGGNSRVDLVNFVSGISWSTLLPDVQGNLEPNAWDGYAYLGLGLMALLLISAGRRIVRRVRGGPPAEDAAAAPSSPAVAPGRVAVSWIPLLVVAAGFLVFAVSNRILFDGDEILAYPWPGFMRAVTATFRGQGRMIWPTYYVLMLAILWFVIRTWRPRTLAYLLAAGLVLQVIDFREGARLMRVGTAGTGLVKPLRDPVWDTVATRYRKLVSIPAFHGQPDRHTLAWFCARTGLGSNIGYFSRMNPRRQQQGAERALEEVLSAHYDPQTVYYFPHAETWNIAKLTASPHDLALVADGHHLLVPDGNPAGTARPADDVVVPSLGTELAFAAGGAGQGFLLDGWSWRESWGTWSDSKTPSFLLPLPRGYRGKLRIVVRWLGHAAPGVHQSAIIHFDDAESTIGFAADGVPQDNTFDVVATHDWIAVRIKIRRPVVETDGRLLGIGLISARMTVPDDPVPPGPVAPAGPDQTR